MVDEIPTTDDVRRVEELNRLREQEIVQKERLVPLTERHSDVINKAKEVMASLGLSAASVTDKLEQLVEGFGQFNLLSRVINSAKQNMDVFASSTTFGMMALTGLIPKNTELLGQLGRAGASAGAQITDSLKTISPVLKAIGFDESIGRFATFADQGRALEDSLLRTAAASGQLNSLYDAMDGSVDNINMQVSTFNDLLFNTAKATGQLPKNIIDFMLGLREIPGALETNARAFDQSNNRMNMTSAALAIASSFGLEHKDVIDDLKFAYRNLNTTGDQALEFIARMGAATQDLQMPMDIVRRFTLDTSSAFKLFGDNTNAAINIMGRFAPTLRQAGLGPEGINQIVNSMTQGISKMDVATKAFISGAAGGPGGLAGAFDIDRMMREGRTDQVLQMTMSAMQKQFGGPIVTQEDVSKTPALAGEFFKQITFLKDVAGIAGSDIEAQRILEAMKTGAPFAAEAVRGPEEAMLDAVKQGVDIQERNFNVLTNIETIMQQAQLAAGTTARDQVRNLVGTGGIFGAELLGGAGLARSATTEGGGITGMTGEGRIVGAVNPQQARENLAAGFIDAIERQVPLVGDVLKGQVTEGVNMLKEAGEGLETGEAGDKTKMKFSDIANEVLKQLGISQPGQATPGIQGQPVLLSALGLTPETRGLAPAGSPTTPETMTREAMAEAAIRGAVFGPQLGQAQAQAPITIDGVLKIDLELKDSDGVTTLVRREFEKGWEEIIRSNGIGIGKTGNGG